MPVAILVIALAGAAGAASGGRAGRLPDPALPVLLGVASKTPSRGRSGSTGMPSSVECRRLTASIGPANVPARRLRQTVAPTLPTRFDAPKTATDFGSSSRSR